MHNFVYLAQRASRNFLVNPISGGACLPIPLGCASGDSSREESDVVSFTGPGKCPCGTPSHADVPLRVLVEERRLWCCVSGPADRRTAAGYLTQTYSSVLQVSPDSHGATYKCTVNFSLSDETTSSVAVDRRSPAFNFTWTSAPPLNVHCKHITLSVYWVVVDHMRILFF